MSNVSLSEEMFYLKHNAQNGAQTRPILNSVLNKLNNTDGDVTALYDGEHTIRANNLLTYSGARKVLKNDLPSGVLKYTPLGKASTEKRSVRLFVDDIPKKESELKLPMTNRGIYTQLQFMYEVLDKITGPKTVDFNDQNIDGQPEDSEGGN